VDRHPDSHRLGVFLLVALLAPAGRAAPGCETCLVMARDCGDIGTVRAAMDAACSCESFDGSRNRGGRAYRRCVRPIIRSAIAAGTLRRQCRDILGRSICGRPERAVCCGIRLSTGSRTCAVRLPARCVDTRRSRRTVEGVQSCADTDCEPPSTPTTTIATGSTSTTTTTTLLPSWAALHAAHIAPRCGNCHGIEGEGGLNALNTCRLGYANLVDVPSTVLPAWDRVAPGLPEASWLMQKLDGSQNAFDDQCIGGSCGAAMPLEPPLLDAAVRDALRAWIANGAPNDCP
jgi:hypothetical protein